MTGNKSFKVFLHLVCFLEIDFKIPVISVYMDNDKTFKNSKSYYVTAKKQNFSESSRDFFFTFIFLTSLS